MFIFLQSHIRGADPQAVDSENRTPLDIAKELNFDDTEVLSLLPDYSG